MGKPFNAQELAEINWACFTAVGVLLATWDLFGFEHGITFWIVSFLFVILIYPVVRQAMATPFDARSAIVQFACALALGVVVIIWHAFALAQTAAFSILCFLLVILLYPVVRHSKEFQEFLMTHRQIYLELPAWQRHPLTRNAVMVLGVSLFVTMYIGGWLHPAAPKTAAVGFAIIGMLIVFELCWLMLRRAPRAGST